MNDVALLANPANPANLQQSAPTPAPRGMLTFRLGDEDYAIDILKVQEIRGYEPVTRIAHAPGFVKGVINLRGSIVPIVDMRLRLDLPVANYDEFTVAIIVYVGHRLVGIVVDGVSDVVSLGADQVQPGPAMAAMDTNCITGLGTLDGRMLILLDIDALIEGIGVA